MHKIQEKIKENAYVKKVIVKRSLPNEIQIQIQERHPRYQLEYGNAYVYVDSQGYLLEITDVPLELPVIVGYHTASEKIEPGNRLEQQDLEDWAKLLKITEVANSQDMGSLITKIDIADKNDYKIYFGAEQKIFHIEDITNIHDRILMVKLVIEKEKGNKGEIFIVNDKEYRFLPME